MRENESEGVRRTSTPGVHIARMKVGRNYSCSIGSGILFDLLVYEFIALFDEIRFDSTVDEI